MERFIKPSTINILGGMPEQIPQPDRERTVEPTPEPSCWKKIKINAKNIWRAIVDMARDIKDTFIPIVSAIGTFLTGMAAFRNRNNQHRGRTA